MRNLLLSATLIIVVMLSGCPSSSGGGGSGGGNGGGGGGHSCDINDNPNAPTVVDAYVDATGDLVWNNTCDEQYFGGLPDNGASWLLTYCCAEYVAQLPGELHKWELVYLIDTTLETNGEWTLIGVQPFAPECDPLCP